MAKKTAHKAKKINSKKKTGRYYLTLSLFSMVSCLVVFVVGNYFNKPQLPCANTKTCQSDLSQHIDNKAIATFEGHTITPPKIDLAQALTPAVLGANTTTGEKHVYIDLSTQRLYAYQGDTEYMDTYIASGKWNPTPVGNFHIWEKLVATRMAGGEGASAYDLPNVPYVMYFYQDYGLHGAYWHNNFGHMMSHGCVNERIVDAKKLYEWADLGTPVSVCNSFTTPNNCMQTNPIN
ncbi:MAG TPA: L,D-transpeptidase [Candidatus Sulfotelmatobacter sp.]|jgi:lipoprotein-anchoring transpeptidase ErfK/SrfK|nr:L,D-transpeptidase [Candidatus Sulfotelmatobacter sp.]